ncbi:hypothetical protein LAZ40_04215 [Cereibacter sphaeroides]|uniref:hypothetical protein n=1 Tax=Cereibacter sphaeroides TaxID=1063 RepID=UPI001F3C9A8A|nr:hypothetical protein [Cereibacter sphaeroides]MCE6958259.1 hypothetical protein [Cereibacter sphaeroides]MCE6971198.1 hypothetical protein [Cereibacter sphaeroides]
MAPATPVMRIEGIIEALDSFYFTARVIDATGETMTKLVALCLFRKRQRALIRPGLFFRLAIMPGERPCLLLSPEAFPCADSGPVGNAILDRLLPASPREDHGSWMWSVFDRRPSQPAPVFDEAAVC